MLLAFVAIGVISGLLAGLLGVGGGLVIVPLLLLVLPAVEALPQVSLMHVAVATSLVVIIPTALFSTYAHARQGAVQWPLVVMLTPGLVAGGLVGAWLAGAIDRAPLQRFFALYTLVAAYLLWRGRRQRGQAEEARPGMGEGSLVALFIGVVSALVGIGGGTMTVPYLHWRGLSLHHAVATSAACGFPIAAAAAAGFIWLAAPLAALPHASGYVYWPAALVIAASASLMAPMGARLAHRLPVAALKKILALVLVLVALRLIFGNS